MAVIIMSCRVIDAQSQIEIDEADFAVQIATGFAAKRLRLTFLPA